MSNAATDTTILQSALEYANLGWRVVPLFGVLAAGGCECSDGAACTSCGKHPRVSKWQFEASSEEEKIAAWFERWPRSNIGIQMGETSGLVDVECDSEAAELALLAIMGGEFPETPTFMARRGKHRLFKWRPDLPHAEKGTFKIGQIDFKIGGGAKGSQSVFPPSLRADLERYRWLMPPGTADLAELSDAAIARIWNYDGGKSNGEAKPREHWDRISQGAPAGKRNETAAQWIGRLLADQKNPYDNSAVSRLWELVAAWNNRNQPPIEDRELKTTFDSILRLHRESWTAAEYEGAAEKYVDRKSVNGEASVAPWSLVKVQSDPVQWRLFSPLWEFSASGKSIRLSSEELLSYRKVSLAALEQAGIPLGPDFKVLWDGTRKEEGLMSKLVRNCDTEASETEERRKVVVAEVLLNQIRRASESTEPDGKGQPRKLPDGSTVFRFNFVLQHMQIEMLSIKSGEVADVLKAIGACSSVLRSNGVPIRCKRISKECLQRLEEIVLDET